MHTPDMTDNVYHALQLKTKLILKVVERETTYHQTTLLKTNQCHVTEPGCIFVITQDGKLSGVKAYISCLCSS